MKITKDGTFKLDGHWHRFLPSLGIDDTEAFCNPMKECPITLGPPVPKEDSSSVKSDIYNLGLAVMEMSGAKKLIDLCSLQYSELLIDLVSKCFSDDKTPTALELLQHPVLIPILNSPKSLYELHSNNILHISKDPKLPIDQKSSSTESLSETPTSNPFRTLERSLTEKKLLESNYDTNNSTEDSLRSGKSFRLLKTAVISASPLRTNDKPTPTQTTTPIFSSTSETTSESSTTDSNSESDSETNESDPDPSPTKLQPTQQQKTETRDERIRTVIRQEIDNYHSRLMTDIHSEMSAVMSILSVISSQVISIQEDMSNLSKKNI